ncbi:MAG: ABC transporter ATP-binding protein [Candidatus Eisenbacteria sp.]|nr:ABC transporter ATP-binding protein [Candidatus Eisenbacteria bacterium]
MLETNNVSKQYQMGKVTVNALAGVDFNVEQSEFVAVMGPSGSGKSTLMNILGCLDTPTQGCYRLGGTDVRDLDDHQLSRLRNREIGFIFQTFNLLPRANARQNVELPLVYAGIAGAARRRLATSALDRVGLVDRTDHKPNELSGGERQRVAIARALVSDPSLLLADEPTGNLDSGTGEEIMRSLNRIWMEGRTVIVVTHAEEIARHTQRILRLHDGALVSDDRRPGDG